MFLSSIPQVSEALKMVLTERATALERPTGFVQRSSAQLDGALFTQTLVFGFLTFPQAELSGNCAMSPPAWGLP